MSTTLAFLSGKGGSGKTTLALSMSHLLYKCNLNVLLVDCDMSTNGATYFYESILFKENEMEQHQITSFNDLLNNEKYINEFVPCKINQYLDFIPSVLKYETEETHTGVNDFKDPLQKFINYTRLKYDVVLFDCQAGYTSVLQILLPLMDIDLFVLETDSISGASMRSLHLKIGQFLGHAHLYQVFNKATDEEFKIYSKIVGTFFTNVGTLLFDWRIRQAFSRSQVPDIDNTSSKYGSDLCDIGKIIFPDKNIQKNLQEFSDQIAIRKLEEEYEQTEKELYKLSLESRSITKNKIIKLLPSLLFGIIFIINFIMLNDILFSNNISDKIIILITTIPFLANIIIDYLFNSINESRTIRGTKYENERKLKDIDKKLKNLNNIKK